MKTTSSANTPPAVWTFLVWIAVCISISGCIQNAAQPSYERDGKTYGEVSGAFRHRWWNYYERGLSFAEGEFYSEAISDLTEAIRRRSADQRMARTYGMHFIDFFPHREVGIVYWEINDLEKAAFHLEHSIDQWPTAKARFYLDRVRREKIRRRGEEVQPPQIRLENAGREIWTRQDPVVLSGTIADENYVSSVRIGSRELFLESARKVIAFSEPLKLTQGIHLISVHAENLGGKSARVDLRVHVDRQGPLITVENADFVQGAAESAVRIRGSVYDPAGIQSLIIAEKHRRTAGQTEVFFDETISFPSRRLKIAALDTLENQTAAEFSPQSDLTRTIRPILLAGKDHLTLRSLAFLGPKDKQPPRIEIKEWKQSPVVYLDRIYLEGSVFDDSGIVSLSINGTSVHRRKGRMIAFGHLAPLAEGGNRFVVSAEDEHGNRATAEIEVIRKIPEALKLEQRLSLTVLPFEQRGAIFDVGLSFQDQLIDALVNRNRFRIVERSLLETLLQEQNFSQTALVERSTALKLGRLAAAHTIVTGSMVENRNGIEAIARLIDVESTEILITEDVYSETPDWISMKNLAEGLALKIHRRFPLVSGMVLEKRGNVVFTDLGEEKIGCQKRLIIYRDHPIRHPLSKKIVGSDMEILSHARVRQVSSEMTKAELMEQSAEPVAAFDKVITQ